MGRGLLPGGQRTADQVAVISSWLVGQIAFRILGVKRPGRQADASALGPLLFTTWGEWAEIDCNEGVWTVPARRMTANRQHRVPLCGRALEILEAAQRSAPDSFDAHGQQPSRRDHCGGSPRFLDSGAPLAEGDGARQISPFPLPFLGVAPSTVIPGGKAIECC